VSNEKKSFILYQEYEQHFALLSNEDSGKLIKAIFEYNKTGNAPNLQPLPHMAFISMKSALDRDMEKYQNVVKQRSYAGKKSGEARAKKKTNGTKQTNVNSVERKQTNVNSVERKRTKLTDNENVNDNENENVNDNVNESVSVNVNESENVITHASVLDISLTKFINAFPNKKLDGELLPEHNIDKLINAINKSKFLKTSNNLGLKWMVEHYNEVVSGNYETFKNLEKDESQLEKARKRLQEEIPYAN